jgi:hypothetical protein
VHFTLRTKSTKCSRPSTSSSSPSPSPSPKGMGMGFGQGEAEAEEAGVGLEKALLDHRMVCRDSGRRCSVEMAKNQIFK